MYTIEIFDSDYKFFGAVDYILFMMRSAEMLNTVGSSGWHEFTRLCSAIGNFVIFREHINLKILEIEATKWQLFM